MSHKENVTPTSASIKPHKPVAARLKSSGQGEDKCYEVKFVADDFRKDVFNPEEFISGLTRELFQDRKEKVPSKHVFNPLPFQQIFNDAMLLLHSIQKETDDTIEDLVKETREAEIAHKADISSLNRSFETSFDGFQRLDQRISKVAHTAVRIGDHLEVVDNQKQRTQHGKEIIQHFLQFNSEDGKQTEKLFSIPKNGHQKKPSKVLTRLHEASAVIQELQRICTDLRITGADRAIDLIAEKANDLENELLDEFEAASLTRDHHRMYKCAKTLLNFHGESVIKRYVFGVMLLPPFDRREEDVLRGRDFSKALDGYYSEIVQCCKNECKTISKVFRRHAHKVIKLLIERIFEDKILQFVDCALDVDERTIHAHLKILDILHNSTQKLVTDLKTLMSNLPQQHTNAGVEVSLEDLMEALFARYRENYMQKETKSLSALVNAAISATLHIPSEEAMKRKRISTSDLGGQRKWKWKRSSTISKEQLKWIDKVIKNDITQQLLQETSVATARCMAVSDPTKKALNVKELCIILLSSLCDNYIEPILDIGESILPDPNPKSEPSFYFIKIVSFITRIVQEVNKQFRSNLLPKMNTSNIAQSHVIAHKDQTFSTIEERVLNGLARVLNAVVNYCARLLSTHQKKTDFRPKDENILPDGEGYSEACQRVTEFLRRFSDFSVEHLDGKNLDCFVAVLGTKFYGVLVDHIKKYSISSTGALLLMRDTKMYDETMQGLYSDSVDELFDNLRHVINIYAVPPKHLRALIADDSKISQMDVQELREFIKLRTDYKSAKIEMLLGGQ